MYVRSLGGGRGLAKFCNSWPRGVLEMQVKYHRGGGQGEKKALVWTGVLKPGLRYANEIKKLFRGTVYVGKSTVYLTVVHIHAVSSSTLPAPTAFLLCRLPSRRGR